MWNNKGAEIICLQKLLVWLGKQKEKASCQKVRWGKISDHRTSTGHREQDNTD